MKYCKSCLFPESKPDLFFDEDGVCDACISAKRKHGIAEAIDWRAREEQFIKILDNAKSRKPSGYNCIVPVSGGKDSVWQAYALKVIHGMHPLAITFDQFDQTPEGIRNLEILKEIGVDHLHFTINPKVVKKLVLKAFELVGDHYWVNHVGIYTVPFYFAAKMEIPLVVFGENPQFEYGGPQVSRDNNVMDRAWRQEFGLMRNLREEDFIDSEISEQDLQMLFFPSDTEMHDKEIFGTFYGFFYPWNAREHLKVAEKFGFRGFEAPPTGAYLAYENIDMKFIAIRERQKYLKYGYARVTDQLNIDLRNGIIERDKALKIAIQRDGKVDQELVDSFCSYIGITLDKYNEIMDSFVNHDLFVKDDNNEWQLKVART
tara:strand:- start:1563 stop:2684 length:1122 start_codon:yes stop_codon:yes gene_type:complete